VLSSLWAAVLLGGCRSHPAQITLPIVPKVATSPVKVHPGDAVAMEYRWDVGQGAPRIEKGFGAFVHFVDGSGALVFTDDHAPVPPPEIWEPGQSYSYKRVILIPELAPAGPLEIRMGLFSSGGKRLGLGVAGGTRNEYPSGHLEVLGKKERSPVLFEDGWYPPEAPAGDPFSSRRWMQKEGRVSFRNRGRDVLVALAGETDHTFPETPVLTLETGGRGIKLQITSPGPFLERVRFRGQDLGSDRRALLRLTMSQSFVPKLLGTGDDSRELSLWVLGLLVADVANVDPGVVLGASEAGELEGLSKVDVPKARPGSPGPSAPAH